MKAISLISGGLDSVLATKLILDQGIDVIGLNCVTPFSSCTHNNCNCVVKRAANKLGIELKVVNLGEEFLEILKNPSYGYGKNMNPCIDCKILMLKKAKEAMENTGAKFIVTGEVLGQRPMSQKRPTLGLIEKKAGVEGILVRPLSAKVLDATEPEKNGLIDRGKLLGISGRGRTEQIFLAKTFDISDYSTPAGGCLLTYQGYAKKVDDLIKHNQLTLDNVFLLKIGRHFRLSPQHKLIVGRDEKENIQLFALAKKGDWIYEPQEEIRGPVALGRGEPQGEAQIEQSCRIVARYCDENKSDLEIRVKQYGDDSQKNIRCAPFKDSEAFAFRI
ncbi:MAG: tRNA 4-thiouridine(8) synthase ThiI [Candidatus Omnitrophica bacterium]|nr:tRNA 4-thiouridine(8) synthase ThiI [Candidatus Omnitrophota bacterium]MDD5352973.1 tRNA 4-thiouridine(8) synthase ThiI [Candidatus Omnitrophota bacterium]MDD5550572.1 tRNA 4-thiouridine(8) synthase ThiI [Candidatus Omnitrophota bacterium]